MGAILRNACLIFLSFFLHACTHKTASVRVDDFVTIEGYGQPNEPSIAVNPSDPKEIIIAANMNWSYYSSDGGESWSTYRVNSEAGVWGDFSAVCDTNGNFLIFHLSSPEGYKQENWLDRIVCQKFDKQARTWRPVSYIGDTSSGTWKDKPMAIINRAANEIALEWTEFDSLPGETHTGKSNLWFATSRDEGKTWTTPVRINKIPGDASLDDSTATAVSLSVNKAGDYFAVWPRLDTIWMNRFDHVSRTWKEHETFVAVQPGGWRFYLPGLKWCNGWPSLTCRTSGVEQELFACWAAKPGNSMPSRIYYTTSVDEGMHWSQAEELKSGSKNTDLFFPVVRVDEASGSYGILAYETAENNKKSIQPVMFTSDNKANGFRKIECLDEPFIADTLVFLGDYISMDVHQGIFYPVWTNIQIPGSEIKMARMPVSGCNKK